MNANQYLHRYGATAGAARPDRPQRPGQRGPQPGRHLPRPDDDGRLPGGPAHHVAVRALRLRRAVRRVDRRRRVGRVGRRRPARSRPIRIEAVGTQITRAGLVGPGHDHPRAAGARAVGPPLDAARACARPTSTSPSSTTASPSTPSRGSRALGFCGLGEAQDWLDGGRRIALDGELPVNPHGGQLSEGRTHGFGFLYEAITQLRHDAGERQVPGATTAVVTSGGGTPSGVLLLQRDRHLARGSRPGTGAPVGRVRDPSVRRGRRCRDRHHEPARGAQRLQRADAVGAARAVAVAAHERRRPRGGLDGRRRGRLLHRSRPGGDHLAVPRRPDAGGTAHGLGLDAVHVQRRRREHQPEAERHVEAGHRRGERHGLRRRALHARRVRHHHRRRARHVLRPARHLRDGGGVRVGAPAAEAPARRDAAARAPRQPRAACPRHGRTTSASCPRWCRSTS